MTRRVSVPAFRRTSRPSGAADRANGTRVGTCSETFGAVGEGGLIPMGGGGGQFQTEVFGERTARAAADVKHKLPVKAVPSIIDQWDIKN